MNFKKTLLENIKKLIKKIYKFIKPKTISPIDNFSKNNYGIIKRLQNIKPKLSYLDSDQLKKALFTVFGIQALYPLNLKEYVKGIEHFEKKYIFREINYKISYFSSYDDLKIPLYVLYPPNFDEKKKYSTIIIFSGHGSAKQVAFELNSYQHGAGYHFAKNNFLVYIMENRGMGRLSYLGNHLRIDAVARLTNGSWYGEILTDALWLIENIQIERNVNIEKLFAAGVSSGGAISMITAAIDNRITVIYVQGYLGTFKKTFGLRANHCLCNNLSNIMNVCELSDIGSLIAPRPALYVNGTADIFYYIDAKLEFDKILSAYKKSNASDKVKFLTPKGIGHEFSIKIALDWFKNNI